MKKYLTAALVSATLIGGAFPVFAGEGEGVVATIDSETRTVVLEDGSTWTAAEDVDIEGLAAGDMIKVVYEDGTTTLTSVEKVEM